MLSALSIGTNYRCMRFSNTDKQLCSVSRHPRPYQNHEPLVPKTYKTVLVSMEPSMSMEQS